MQGKYGQCDPRVALLKLLRRFQRADACRLRRPFPRELAKPEQADNFKPLRSRWTLSQCMLRTGDRPSIGVELIDGTVVLGHARTWTDVEHSAVNGNDNMAHASQPICPTLAKAQNALHEEMDALTVGGGPAV